LGSVLKSLKKTQFFPIANFYCGDRINLRKIPHNSANPCFTRKAMLWSLAMNKVMGRVMGRAKLRSYGQVVGILIGLGVTLGLMPSFSHASELSISTTIYQSPSGKLRVSNRSEHPIRLAMRLKSDQVRGDKYNEKVSQRDRYEAPAHWDFYAGEGRDRGLVVALPNRSLHLSKGDVVIAFAQDGSRRYWGPFIVGETDNPVWNPATQEWKLILED
jgi:hypothetical protein